MMSSLATLMSRSVSMVILDTLIFLCAIYLAALIHLDLMTERLATTLSAGAMMAVLCVAMGFYRRDAASEPFFVLRGAVAVLTSVAAIALLDARSGDAQAVGLAIGVAVAGMVAVRFLLNRLSEVATARRRPAFVASPETMRTVTSIAAGKRMVMGRTVTCCPSDWAEARARIMDLVTAPDITELVLDDALVLDRDLTEALAQTKARGVRIQSVGAFLGAEFGRLAQDDPSTARDVLLLSPVCSRVAGVIKRIMDIVVALVILIAAAPVMAAAAIAIRAADGGPVFYRQVRTGRDARPFTLIKFRSMRIDAEAPGQAQWASMRDPRVTPIGGFLRKSRIDELPQLINVLRGDMSMVGPRPERPELVAQLRDHIPLYALRHLVTPGITGWAQINYPYGASIEDAIEKTRYDLYYVRNWSLLLDLRIILETIRVVLFAQGSR